MRLSALSHACSSKTAPPWPAGYSFGSSCAKANPMTRSPWPPRALLNSSTARRGRREKEKWRTVRTSGIDRRLFCVAVLLASGANVRGGVGLRAIGRQIHGRYSWDGNLCGAAREWHLEHHGEGEGKKVSKFEGGNYISGKWDRGGWGGWSRHPLWMGGG